jgi:hypothetical protein
LGRVGSGWVGLGWVGLGQVGSGLFRSGQVRSGQVRSGQVRSGQVRLGYVNEYSPVILDIDKYSTVRVKLGKVWSFLSCFIVNKYSMLINTAL